MKRKIYVGGLAIELNPSITLMLPVPDFSGCYNFQWVEGVANHPRNIDVIVFKTASKAEFKPMMEDRLKILKEQLQRELSFMDRQCQMAEVEIIEKTLDEMSNPAFLRVPDDWLLESVSEGFEKKFEKDNVIFYSALV